MYIIPIHDTHRWLLLQFLVPWWWAQKASETSGVYLQLLIKNNTAQSCISLVIRVDGDFVGKRSVKSKPLLFIVCNCHDLSKYLVKKKERCYFLVMPVLLHANYQECFQLQESPAPYPGFSHDWSLPWMVLGRVPFHDVLL